MPRKAHFILLLDRIANLSDGSVHSASFLAKMQAEQPLESICEQLKSVTRPDSNSSLLLLTTTSTHPPHEKNENDSNRRRTSGGRNSVVLLHCNTCAIRPPNS